MFDRNDAFDSLWQSTLALEDYRDRVLSGASRLVTLNILGIAVLPDFTIVR
jgi:hypothetical protein